MANTPVVAVGPPDELGWRHVTINDHDEGKVRSLAELQKLLRRAGLECGRDIHWIGGDCTAWPDRAVYRRVVGTLMAIGLLATAYTLFTIGTKDTFGALTYAGRITGITFLLATGFEVIAAAAAFDYWHERKVAHSGMAILIGVSISLVVSSVLLFVQIVDGWKYTNHLPLWILYLMWSIWALVVLIRDHAWKGIPNPRRIVAGAVVSGLLAITNITYTQIYVPYATSPLVQSAASFGRPSLDKERTKMYLPVHLSVKNSGQIPVYVLGTIYWIRGVPMDGKPDKRESVIHDGEFIKPPGRALHPGEEFSEDEVFEIKQPEKFDYESVAVQAELYAIRKDRVTIVGNYERSGKSLKALMSEGKDNDPQGPDEKGYFRYQTDISNSNEILNVTRGRQRITVWYVSSKDSKKGHPYIYAVVAPPDERVDFDRSNIHANKKAIDRYGLESVRGSIEQKPFAELMEMAQAEPSVGESPAPKR